MRGSPCLRDFHGGPIHLEAPLQALSSNVRNGSNEAVEARREDAGFDIARLRLMQLSPGADRGTLTLADPNAGSGTRAVRQPRRP